MKGQGKSPMTNGKFENENHDQGRNLQLQRLPEILQNNLVRNQAHMDPARNIEKYLSTKRESKSGRP